MDALLTVFLGQPLWMWLGFIALVGLLLAFDLGVLHKGSKEIGVSESLALSAAYIALALAFGAFVWLQLGSQAGVEYLTGFVVEKSLAMDNLFLIAMIFSVLSIPRQHQHRVLFWGILGVIVLRAVMIGVGAALVTQFAWVLYVFAGFLVLTGIKMLVWQKETPFSESPVYRFLKRRLPLTDRLHGDRFFVRERDAATGRTALMITPLFLALAIIEVADIIFAVDSIPAIFAITTDPYVVYTSNVFAILGLRALYFALAAVMHRFAYLKHALAILLIFIGGKVFIADMLGLTKFPPEWSLSITFAILGGGILYSLQRTRAAPAWQYPNGGH